MVKVKVSAFQDLNNADFQVKSREIHDLLSASVYPEFATPPVPLATLLTMVTLYNTLLVESESGSRIVIQQRNLQRDTVTEALRQIADWAEYQCRNTVNAAEMLSSIGFVPQKQGKTPAGPLPAPTGVQSSISAEPGGVNLEWRAVEKCPSYAIEMCDGGADINSVWRPAGFSLRVKHTITGLERGKMYSFRVRSYHATTGYSAPSEITTCMAG